MRRIDPASECVRVQSEVRGTRRARSVAPVSLGRDLACPSSAGQPDGTVGGQSSCHVDVACAPCRSGVRCPALRLVRTWRGTHVGPGAVGMATAPASAGRQAASTMDPHITPTSCPLPRRPSSFPAALPSSPAARIASFGSRRVPFYDGMMRMCHCWAGVGGCLPPAARAQGSTAYVGRWLLRTDTGL